MQSEPMTSSIRSCICCNPLFKRFITHLTRRKFLLGTGAFAAAVIGGNLGGSPAQSQTEGIRMLSEELFFHRIFLNNSKVSKSY